VAEIYSKIDPLHVSLPHCTSVNVVVVENDDVAGASNTVDRLWYVTVAPLVADEIVRNLVVATVSGLCWLSCVRIKLWLGQQLALRFDGLWHRRNAVRVSSRG